ncbi:MAG: C4-type zinc ribbon domain-containing protein [Bacteroidota bacterium]|nr:C4-type zinc ribbon domain-containing protein [Bacteroidota bacterium]
MEHSTEKKLEKLLKLQEIDSKIFEIKKVRGALPQEVQDLEDELIGYNTRLDKFKEDIDIKNKDIDDYKIKISEAKKLIKKYKDQQMNVRNNREYDAISKEIESQDLDTKLFVKKSAENDQKIEGVKEEIKATKKIIKEKTQMLKSKKSDLDVLSSESQEEEKKLNSLKTNASKKIEPSLLLSYEKLVERQRNGLAVVRVSRSACGGCFNIVPPQRQAEVKEKKKIILCEYCGRILADVIAEIIKEKPKKRKKRKTAKKS